MTELEPSSIPPPVGRPVRLLAHDWPFLYSVLPNGDLVVNKRLQAAPKRAVRNVDISELAPEEVT